MSDTNLPSNPPELLFQLGRLQVFHYPSMDDRLANRPPKDVFWQDSVSKHTYGPFPTIYNAMSHYTWIVSTQKASQDPNVKAADVIYVDFTRKKRILFALPQDPDKPTDK